MGTTETKQISENNEKSIKELKDDIAFFESEVQIASAKELNELIENKLIFD